MSKKIVKTCKIIVYYWNYRVWKSSSAKSRWKKKGQKEHSGIEKGKLTIILYWLPHSLDFDPKSKPFQVFVLSTFLPLLFIYLRILIPSHIVFLTQVPQQEIVHKITKLIHSMDLRNKPVIITICFKKNNKKTTN